MAVTATSNLAKIDTALRTTLANVTAWQTWTETDNATDAAELIGLGQFPPGDIRIMPRARVGFGSPSTPVTGAGGGVIPSGTRQICFIDHYDPEASIEDQRTKFLNNVGAVIEGLIDLGQNGSGAYLFITDVREEDEEEVLTFPPDEAADDDQYLQSIWTVFWGLEGVSG